MTPNQQQGEVPPGIVAFKDPHENANGFIHLKINSDRDYEDWVLVNQKFQNTIHTIQVDGKQFSVGDVVYNKIYSGSVTITSFEWRSCKWVCYYANEYGTGCINVGDVSKNRYEDSPNQAASKSTGKEPDNRDIEMEDLMEDQDEFLDLKEYYTGKEPGIDLVKLQERFDKFFAENTIEDFEKWKAGKEQTNASWPSVNTSWSENIKALGGKSKKFTKMLDEYFKQPSTGKEPDPKIETWRGTAKLALINMGNDSETADEILDHAAGKNPQPDQEVKLALSNKNSEWTDEKLGHMATEYARFLNNRLPFENQKSFTEWFSEYKSKQKL